MCGSVSKPHLDSALTFALTSTLCLTLSQSLALAASPRRYRTTAQTMPGRS